MPASSMFYLLAAFLVLAGSALLIGLLYQNRQLCRRLPQPPVLAKRMLFYGLMVAACAGYLAYLGMNWHSQKNWRDLIVPFILFTAALVLLLQFNLTTRPLLLMLQRQEHISDPLMGIYNRRYIEHRLVEEVARAQRYHVPLSALLLDIDHLSAVNQRYGHQIGDQVLVHVAKLLQEYLRESDEVARYEADEVLVMAPNTSLSDAHNLAERIRQRIEAQPLLLNPHSEQEQRIEFKVSIGVSAIQGSYDSLEKLLQRCETALQQASSAGGNRVQATASGQASSLG